MGFRDLRSLVVVYTLARQLTHYHVADGRHEQDAAKTQPRRVQDGQDSAKTRSKDS